MKKGDETRSREGRSEQKKGEYMRTSEETKGKGRKEGKKPGVRKPRKGGEFEVYREN
jgi:hypothetical protein